MWASTPLEHILGPKAMKNGGHFTEIGSGIAVRGLYTIAVVISRARSLMALRIRNVQWARFWEISTMNAQKLCIIQCTISGCTFGWNAHSDKIHIQTECAFEKDTYSM